MNNVLIVSSSPKSCDYLSGFIKESFTSDITISTDGSDARRTIGQKEFAVVLINTPLTDEFGHELAMFITEETSSGVLIIVKSEIADDLTSNVEDYGILTVAKPINRTLLYQSVKLAFSTHSRVIGYKRENIKLQSKIEEIRLVDRAKCALIQYLNMTEQQAHRYIEKQAMDMRMTKQDIALGIIKTYEIY